MKALNILIYKFPLGDCTNRGISSKFNDLLLTCDKAGGKDIDEKNPPENLCKLVTRNIAGKEYKYIEPVKPVKKGNVGYCSGGNIAYSNDARFPSDYPLSIHDRQDTQEQYDALTR